MLPLVTYFASWSVTDDDDDRRRRASLVWPSTLCVGGPVITYKMIGLYISMFILRTKHQKIITAR